MENTISQIKKQEKIAEHFIWEAQQNAQKKLEKEKIKQQNLEIDAKSHLTQEKNKLIQTAEIEAEKETNQIAQLTKQEIEKLDKVDINKGVNLAINEILSE